MRCPGEEELELYAINMVAGTFSKAKKTERENFITEHIKSCSTCLKSFKNKAENYNEIREKASKLTKSGH